MSFKQRTKHLAVLAVVLMVGISGAVGVAVANHNGDTIEGTTNTLSATSGSGTSATITDSQTAYDINHINLDVTSGTEEVTVELVNTSDSSVVASTTFANGSSDAAQNLDVADKIEDGTAYELQVSVANSGDASVDWTLYLEDVRSASFTTSPEDPEVNETTTFNASTNNIDAENATYDWTVYEVDSEGNETEVATYTGESVEHTFSNESKYKVEMTVTADDDTTFSESATYDLTPSSGGGFFGDDTKLIGGAAVVLALGGLAIGGAGGGAGGAAGSSGRRR